MPNLLLDMTDTRGIHVAGFCFMLQVNKSWICTCIQICNFKQKTCTSLNSVQSWSETWKAIGGIPIHNCLSWKDRLPG